MDILKLKKNKIAAYAIRLWMNYVETSDILLSSQDAKMMHEPIKDLSDDQINALKYLNECYEYFLYKN